MFRQRKLTANSIIQRLAALRFFFVRSLHKPWGVIESPYPKKVLRLPTVLSQEEVAQLINSATPSFYRIILMTLYATGARCAEVARLQVRDIDSPRMVVHIQRGKGRKDRDVMHQSPPARSLAGALALAEAPGLALPGRALAHGLATHRHQDRLARLLLCRPRGGLKKGVHPHTLAPLFCDTSPRRTCVPSNSARPPWIWKRPPSTSTFPAAISALPPVPWTLALAAPVKKNSHRQTNR